MDTELSDLSDTKKRQRSPRTRTKTKTGGTAKMTRENKTSSEREDVLTFVEDDSIPESISIDFVASVGGTDTDDESTTAWAPSAEIAVNDDLPTADDKLATAQEQNFSTQPDEQNMVRRREGGNNNFHHRSGRVGNPSNETRMRRDQRAPGKFDNQQGQINHQNRRTQNQGNQNGNQPRQKFARTVRIGQLSTGQIKSLDCLTSYEKLTDFVVDNLDFSQAAFDFNRAYENRVNLSTSAFIDDLDMVEQTDKSAHKLLEYLLQKNFSAKQPIIATGALETIEGGDGLLVYSNDNYRIRPQSAFIPKFLITKYGLRRGQEIVAYLHPPTQNSTCPFVVKLESVMGVAPEMVSVFPKFKDLVPFYPTERLFLECQEETKWDNVSMRIIDILTPIGLGQRGLIVAPPRTGKTVLLQGIANAISKNRPDVKLIILLIDERPEEVTDFRRQVANAEIVSSTFDESTDNHVHAADMVIDKARRLVEANQHVVILLDSITRLARAHNTEQPSSGKLLSGGVDANALQAPKRFFGAARNIEGGGSLTILATALVETGSRMDEVIFEEFKGTGNMELHLDRGLVDKRMFPALNIEKSGTRKEELLYHPDEMEKVYALRRAMKGVPVVDAMEMLIQRIRKTKSNTEFLLNVNR